VAGFIGEYSHTISGKGRLIVPVRFRERLGEEFVVTKGLDGCLCAYAQSDWDRFEEKISELHLTDPKARNFSRQFLGGATLCETDAQGRILIPQKLRDYAGLTKDVTLVGVGTRVEIWDSATWEKVSDMDADEMARNMEDLGI